MATAEPTTTESATTDLGTARNSAPADRSSTAPTVGTVPAAVHLGSGDLPFVEIGDGSKLKVVHVDAASELWIVENVFQAGYVVPRHRHTGPVYAYTSSGAWRYQEYDDVNRAGSFLFEPTGSVHTLEGLEDDTHVWFQIYGQNLSLDVDGNVESVFDGPGTLEGYYLLCEAEGHPRPNVLVS